MAVSGITIEEVKGWKEELEEVARRIGPRFSRSEPRTRAMKYITGLLSSAERKNAWHLAEAVGEETPYGIQFFLSRAEWSADAVRDDLLQYMGDRLADKEAILVVDETGFLKKGVKSAGVARQYSGTAGKIENSQVGVFLSSHSRHGQVLIDRELYLPQEWTEDRQRCREAGIPDEREFLTKPQLAQRMLQRAMDAGLPFEWITADSIYGDARWLRLWLEERECSYVMAVSGKEYVWCSDFHQYRVGTLLKGLPREGWKRLSCGEGTKGPREYAWLLLSLMPPLQEGFVRGLLVRRSISDPHEMQAYVVFAPSETRIEEMVQVAGARWSIEIAFEAAKSEVGLDQYEVRTYEAWYRHITLCLWAQALLTAIRQSMSKRGRTKMLQHTAGAGRDSFD